jgi:hypothetical protein
VGQSCCFWASILMNCILIVVCTILLHFDFRIFTPSLTFHFFRMCFSALACFVYFTQSTAPKGLCGHGGNQAHCCYETSFQKELNIKLQVFDDDAATLNSNYSMPEKIRKRHWNGCSEEDILAYLRCRNYRTQ